MTQRPVPVLEALSIGPAVPPGGGAFRVRGVYRSVANLEVEGWPYLVALTSVGAAALPNGVELPVRADFAASGLRPGESGRWANDSLTIPSWCRLDLSRARRRRAAAPAASGKLGVAYGACLQELARHQARTRCDLRVGSVVGPAVGRARAGGSGPFAARLEEEARSAASAARARDPGALAAAAGRLVGLGNGLTPSGDDFLCGLMAAALSAASALHAAAALDAASGSAEAGSSASAAALADALADALRAGAAETTEVSASFLSLAAAGYFHEGLLRLCAAVAADDEPGAVSSLRAVCALGHSSGADLATGFLAGLDALAA